MKCDMYICHVVSCRKLHSIIILGRITVGRYLNANWNIIRPTPCNLSMKPTFSRIPFYSTHRRHEEQEKNNGDCDSRKLAKFQWNSWNSPFQIHSNVKLPFSLPWYTQKFFVLFLNKLIEYWSTEQFSPLLHFGQFFDWQPTVWWWQSFRQKNLRAT